MEKKDRSFQNGLLIGISATLAVVAVLVVAGTFFLLPNLLSSRQKTGGQDNGEASWTEKIQEIQAYIDAFYIFDVDADAMADSLLAGYVAGLGDPYSVYYTEEELDSVLESTNGAYYGIGVLVGQMEDGSLQVVNVFRNSPAMEAGMEKEDRIVGVDGQNVEGMELDQVVAYIKGAEGSQVTVTVYRASTGETLDLSMERREVEVDTVEYRMLEDGMGYLQLVEFDDVSLAQMESALADLEAQGMEGLILDLRDNPGGLLTSVVDIADLFLGEENIFYMEDKAGNRVEYDAEEGTVYSGPLVVLVNGNTASAAEVLSGTLQDHGVAQLVGTTTFGKGIVQTFYELSDGSGIKLTTAHYFTPNGTDIHGAGIQPDVTVEREAGAEADVQLEQAQELLQAQMGQQAE